MPYKDNTIFDTIQGRVFCICEKSCTFAPPNEKGLPSQFAVIGLDDERNQPFRLLNIPEFAGCVGMLVSGDSMYPSIASGSIVAIDPTPASYIINGGTYLVVTRDGQRMIKRLVQQGDKVRCISDNPNKELYAPFEIDAEIIHTISRVRGSVSVRSL